jgi:hypothetical protein
MFMGWNYYNIFQENIFWGQALDISFHDLQVNVKVISKNRLNGDPDINKLFQLSLYLETKT